jgi:hypothetical protein
MTTDVCEDRALRGDDDERAFIASLRYIGEENAARERERFLWGDDYAANNAPPSGGAQ